MRAGRHQINELKQAIVRFCCRKISGALMLVTVLAPIPSPRIHTLGQLVSFVATDGRHAPLPENGFGTEIIEHTSSPGLVGMCRVRRIHRPNLVGSTGTRLSLANGFCRRCVNAVATLRTQNTTLRPAKNAGPKLTQQLNKMQLIGLQCMKHN